MFTTSATWLVKVRALAGTVVFLARVLTQGAAKGLLAVTHHALVLMGLGIVALLVFLSHRDDIRHHVETTAFGWLQARHEARQDPVELFVAGLREPEAVQRATAADPKALSGQQASVAQWISKRYKVAPEPISRLVQEAWTLGSKVNLEPTLLLAIMAVESGFNPFAQSAVGAQGLMQVMTRVHDDKYEAFGGTHAAFDPVTNLRVGVLVLKECIARAGGLEAGLRHYVGAANSQDNSGYAGKVLAEQVHLRNVAAGRAVAINAPIIAATPAPVETAPLQTAIPGS
jgi:Transglycosylase SLT domain